MCSEVIERAIEICGTQVEFAKRLGCTYQNIQGWKKTGRIPAERVLQVESITDGQLTRYEIRPDIYQPTAA